jgi:drug/metabolite transporter (DMT)-like permease
VSDEVWRGNLAAFVSALLWASAFPVTQVLLETWDPLPLAAARLGLGSATMLTMAFVFRQLPTGRTVPWRTVACLGGFGTAASVLCLISGQALSDPVTAAAIATLQPVAAALLGFFAGRERLATLQIAGILLAVTGALMVSLALHDGGMGFRGGEPLLVANVVLWTWYSRAARERLAGLGDLAIGGLTMVVGSSVLALMAVAVGFFTPQAVDLGGRAMPWLLWMGVVAIGGSVPLWLMAARLLGVTIASLHINLAPFYVILIGLTLGGSIGLQQSLGAGLVAVGAVIAQRARQQVDAAAARR